MKSFDYDIAIIGGGLVGLTLAHALHVDIAKRLGAKNKPFKIAVLDSKPLHDFSQVDSALLDARTTALSMGSAKMVQQIGLWSRFGTDATAIKDIEISEQGSFGCTHISNKDMHYDALGYVLDNRTMTQGLLSALSESSIELLGEHSTQELTPILGGMRISCQHRGVLSDLTARLAILADGGRSDVYQQLGLEFDEKDYHQVAMISNMALDQPHNGLAMERFGPEGPMALLPIGGDHGQQVSLVYCLAKERAASFQLLNDSDILRILQDQLGYRLGRLTAIGQRSYYPLSLRLVKEASRAHLVVLGNAAHTVHPVAGQGFNLALRDVMALKDIIIENYLSDHALGDAQYLARYHQQQRKDQQFTVGLTDGLISAFTFPHLWAKTLRSFGFLALDRSGPVKKHFAKKAMGLLHL